MKIVGMLSTYNEEDFVEEVIEHLLDQGLELVILDNGSSDNTFEICKKFQNQGVLKLVQFKSSTYQWAIILIKLYDMALRESPDWVIRSDSDELLESGRNNLTLKDAIVEVDSQGFNLIQFDEFNFFMTDKDNENSNSVKKRMTYYSWVSEFMYRCWKYSPGIRVEDQGGHIPVFPPDQKYKIFTRNFVIRHYNIRSKEQAEQKVMQRRARIINTMEGERGWHNRYEKYLENNFKGFADHKLLTKYDENNNWNYEKTFDPLKDRRRVKRDDLFTKDGSLKNYSKTVPEFQLILQKRENENIELKNTLQELKSIRDRERKKFLELKKQFNELSSKKDR